MSGLFDFDTQEYQRRAAQLRDLQSRSMSMRDPCTGFDGVSDNSITSPRHSMDMERLHESYLEGQISGSSLLKVPNWRYEDRAYRCGFNNNDRWCSQAKAVKTKDFYRDPVSNKVALKSRATTSKWVENTDNRTGLTIRTESRTNSSESTFHRSMSDSSTCRSHPDIEPEKEEKKKKKKKKFWSFLGFGKKN